MDYLVHHMLESSARRHPEKDALVHDDVRLSYREIAARVASLAEGLRRCGVQHGDRVGIYSEPSVPQALSLFAVCKAGGVCVPINPRLFSEQVAHVAKDCRMSVLLTSKAKLAALKDVLDDIPSLDSLVVVGESGGVSARVPVHSFDSLCAVEPERTWRETAIGKDLAAILYTSGSTGKPKGVMLSHANILAGSSIVSSYLEITAADRILAALPFSFDAGMNQIMTAWQQGGTIVLVDFVFAREIVQMLVKEKITGLAGVPTLWSLLAQPSSSLHRQPLPHLRYITSTGGPIPQPVLAALRKMLPSTKIYLMYGLTEAFRSTYLPPDELERRPSSIGKAVPDTEVFVIGDDGRLCKPGETGELVHRGPTVSLGYWGLPEETAKVLRPNPLLPPELGDCERVCYSGDLVKMDEDGFLYFVGRRDMMIKSSGYRISPTEVEEVIIQSGEVRHAAVIGVPDDLLGQAVKAFVVAREGETLDLDALIAYCASRIPRYMLPKTFEILDEMPQTSSGKVDYMALRRREGFA